jgi:sugar transferase (PEP-CTERM/EpsH1 system associated)
VANLLYLVHRLPYPPNKGDKIRSFHLLEHLASRHRIFLGTFIDDPEDAVHLGAVRAMCADLHVAQMDPGIARLRSLGGLLNGDPLTLGYYGDAGLSHWVRETVARHAIRTAVVYSSSMAQYVGPQSGLDMLVDFVDVDSAKWSQYAGARRWPLSWLYRREGERLLDYERSVVRRAKRSFFVSEEERSLFRRLVPEAPASVDVMGNGVDAVYFAPDPSRASPFDAFEIPIVFTGAMDYWPNVDAVGWFTREVMPRLQEPWPRVRMHIVGRNPTGAVRALTSSAVRVTGGVPDVRPYLQHAAIVVAPLRIARGIQNKVLEAMAMARPVVAAQACVDSIGTACAGALLGASDAVQFAERIDGLLREPRRATALGSAARAAVLRSHSWGSHMSSIDSHLDTAIDEGALA